VRYIFEFLAVAREEHCARAGPVSDAYDVALDVLGTVGRAGEGLVVPAEAVGEVGYGLFVVSCGFHLANISI
jgi:hypothetical protein